MLVIYMKEVPHISDVVVGYAQKVPVWVRRVVAMLRSSNYEVFLDLDEGLYGDVGREIIGKWYISGKGFF